jgi:hypothetical protein
MRQTIFDVRSTPVWGGRGGAVGVRPVRSDEARGTKLARRKPDYVYDPSFDAADAGSTILGLAPDAAHGARPGVGLPSRLAGLHGDAPLLSREQEVHLFRKLNYLKYRAAMLREAPIPVRSRTADHDEVERLESEARKIRNQIMRANLRLVISIAGLDGADKRTLGELGKELGVTKERVRQIESHALEKLRKLARQQDIPFLAP